jgi:hydroxymethylbilane synthase
MERSLIIGSRGSKLALWQAEQIRSQLQANNPTLTVTIEIIKTTGDVKPDPLSVIGGKGVFTKELEDALLARRIDIAVHSLKDLPTVVPGPLTIAAICERDDPRDALVLRTQSSSTSLSELAAGAVVGTSSQRRLAQLRAKRADVVIKDLRGNVDTRIRKLDEGQYDALILAAAGLRRLGLQDRISAAIPTDEMLPAVGQGAIAVETRSADHFAIATVRKLDHAATRVACLAERSLLRSLGGGCQFPIAAHGVLHSEHLRLDALVATPDGSRILRGSITGTTSQPEELGQLLASQLREDGADELLSEFLP